MRILHPSIVLLAVIGTSLLTTSLLYAQERSARAGDARPTGILSGLTGLVTARGTADADTPRPLKFRNSIRSGEQIATEAASTAEFLWGKLLLLTVFEQSLVRITEQPGQTVVHLTAGTVRVAVAGSVLGPGDRVVLEMPTARVVTRSGILQANARPATRVGSASDHQQAAHGRLVSYVYPQSIAAGASSTEAIQVLDGQAEVSTGGPTPDRRSIEKGQELLVEGGRFTEREKSGSSPERPIVLAAVSPHALTPQEGTVKLVGDQQALAEQLIRTLTGGKKDSETPRDTSITSTKDAIISTTVGNSTSSGSSGAGVNLPGFPGAAPGISPPGTSVVDPPGDLGFNLVTTPSLPNLFFPRITVNGGAGLLLINHSSIVQTKESLLVDGGRIETDFKKFPTELDLPFKSNTPPMDTAPHNGIAPTLRLAINSLHGNNQTLDVKGDFPFPDGEPIPSSPNKDTRPSTVYVHEDSSHDLFSTLSQFGNNSKYDPGQSLKGELVIFNNNNGAQDNGIDAIVRARSSSDKNLGVFDPTKTGTITSDGRELTDRTVVLKSGVVFHDSAVTAGPQGFTQHFSNQLNNINSSIAALLGRDETGQEPGSHPAFVRMQDRILSVLNNGSIVPDNANTTKLSLLTILDSQLVGPTAPPDLFPGDPQPIGVPNGKARTDVPPLIEIIDSRRSQSDPNIAVTAQSAITMRAELDSALLEASAPLISLINSSMRTTGDFAHISGAQAQLTANVPNDQLVLRGAVQLSGSTLSVAGHLFNMMDGAKASLTGNLVALANGSTLNITGALINVGAGSSFSLSSGSLVSFGIGTNSVNITGESCPGCVLRTNIPHLTAGLHIVAHPSAHITVQDGFVPFAGVGTGATISGHAFNNTVNLPHGNQGAIVVGNHATLVLQR